MTHNTPIDRDLHQTRLLHRLRRIEGQIRGIQAMMSRGDDCAAIAQQLAAARKALDRCFHEMIACSLRLEIDQDPSPTAVQAATEQMTRLLAKYG